MKKIIWLLMVALVVSLAAFAGAEECAHEWSEWYPVQGDGMNIRYCTKCDATQTQIVAGPTVAPTAAPTAEPTVAPTAEPTVAPTAEPTVAPTVAPTEAPADEHTWTAWKVVKAATCTEEGEERRGCTTHGERETRVIPKLSHDYKWSVQKEATCTEDGLKVGKCANCGDEQTETIAKGAHVYGEWHVSAKPTCDKDGLKVAMCTVPGCGDVKKEAIPAAHTYGEWKVQKAATCSKTGVKVRMCSVCGDVEKGEIAKLAHTEVIVPGKAATCTEAGLTDGKKCSDCGEITVEQKEIAPKGHTEVAIPAVAATCEENGLTAGKKCSVCDTVLVAPTEVKAIGHKYVVKVIAPTTTSRGYNANRCKNCGNFFRSNYVDKLAAEVAVANLGDIVLDAQMNAVAYTATATQDAAKVLTIKADAAAKPVVRILSLTLAQVELLKAEGYQTIVFVVGEHELVIPMDVFAQDMLNVVVKDLGEAAVGYNFTVDCSDACTMKVEIVAAEGATDVTVVVTGVELK